eukprot:scaffold6981_cov70-Phaeocystis_antarctica.AAC.3
MSRFLSWSGGLCVPSPGRQTCYAAEKFAQIAPNQGRERPDATRGGFGEIGRLRGIGTATTETGKCVSARSS